ncbi:MAG: hypothetical protein ASUL_07869 [Candidatus Aramenus sulfurataquae]|uniref:Uncharacterized protein n=1 Tax=Candidatus Aramenus sulfurataquae TaxID=1326980 RepID=W7KKF1_9CREN|nr:MAG: hypothetical protein ASUL_07869 [Candidatus Aramenus sulfurataquae]
MSDLPVIRFYVYDTFSEIFFYKINDDEYKVMIDKVNKVSENLGQAIKEVSGVDFPRIAKKFSEIKKKDYAIEYTTLFLTGLGLKPLMPVESRRTFAISGEKQALRQYLDITSFYERRGVVPKVAGSFIHEPDHITTILAFMALLAREEIEERKEGKDFMKTVKEESEFLNRHVVNWVIDWARDVMSDPRANLFKVVCEELAKWIEFDYREISKVLPKVV